MAAATTLFRASPVEAPFPSGLEHHLDLYDRLAERAPEPDGYRAILESVLGFSLEHAVISTSEHAAPFNFASSVSYALPQMALQHSGRRPPAQVVILVGTLVPFDNRHYPRGFVLEGGDRFNLFSVRVMKSCPQLQPAANVVASAREGSASFFARYPWLRPYLDGSIAFPDAGHQLAKVMEAMAARWLPAHASPVAIRPVEDVARRVLVRLLEERDPWLSRLLFDRETRHLIGASLTGTFCAWGARHGSFLFWKRRGDRLERFSEEDGHLVSGDRGGDTTRIPLERTAILEALSEGAILPGVFLTLLATSFLPNLAVAGGPKQPEYWRKMIRAANHVGGLTRDERLSAYGYWCVDMDRIVPNRNGTTAIPKDGAGLFLTNGIGEPEQICQELARCPVRPIEAPPSYD